MSELTVGFESTEHTRFLRYWPAREPTPDKPGRAYRVEQAVTCDECRGLRKTFDDEGCLVDCEVCDSKGGVWVPLHWVEREGDG